MSDRAPKPEEEVNLEADDDSKAAPSPAAGKAEGKSETGKPEGLKPARTGKFLKRGVGRAPAGTTTGGSSDSAAEQAPVKSKGKKKKAKEPEEQLELEPISPFSRGISIGIKFAALTAAVVALSMTLLGYLTYSITEQEVDAQINQGGVVAVSALEKGVDRMFWVRPDALLKDTGFVEKEWDSSWSHFKKYSQDELNERLKALVEQSQNQILSAAIVERAGQSESGIAIYPQRFSVSQTPLPKIGNVDVYEGNADVAGKRTLVRRFDKEIVDAEGKPVKPQAEGARAYATVFVNAAKIVDVRDRVQQRIMLVTGMGALAGVILTAVIAAVLSRPIRALEGDIALVAEGNLDHETIVRSGDEIGALAHTFNIMTRNLKAAQQHAADRKAIERELAIATEIQTKLLPERIPQIPGLDIHSFYLSAKEVGGDYYDFIVIDQTHLGIIVADVSGKGIPGSMVMTMARSLVRLASVRNISPADTFKKVNRILAKDIRRGMFVTSIYMVLNVKTHELKVASAGHNPLVVFRAESGEYELVKPQGIALGFDKGTIFDNHIQEVELQLKPGDRICAYTDGVNEAMDPQSEEFGDERFYNLVKQHARLSSKDFVNAIVAEVEAHRAGGEQSDDITITTLAVMK